MKPISQSPILIVIIPYLVLSALWIIITNQLIVVYTNPPPDIITIELWKDFAFVVASAALISTIIHLMVQRYEQTHAELRRQKTLFECQTEAAIDGILIVGTDRQIQSYNQRFVEIANLSPDALQTRSSEALMKAVLDQLVDPQEFVQRIQYLYQHPQEKSRDEIATRDGRILDRYSAPIQGPGGDYYGRVWFYRDITELKHAQETLREREATFRSLVESMNDIVFTLGTNQRHTGLYGNWVKRYGLSADFFLGKTSREISDPATARIHEAANIRALSGETVVYEWSSVDGLHVQTSLSPIYDSQNNITGIVGVGRDITLIKNAEQQLRHANRALKTLSACNQALVRANDEHVLLHDICQMIVQVGGYSLAWAGFAELEGDKRIIPLVSAGDENGYLDNLYLTWDNTPYGRGPTGKALRSRKAWAINTIESDEDFSPWREQALRHGYHSVLSLPLLADNPTYPSLSVAGVLSLYSSQPDAFNEQEIELLNELASDVVYGIVTLRTRAEHQRTQGRLANILEIAANAMIAVDEHHHIILFNPAAELIFGYRSHEVLNKPFPMLLMPSYSQRYYTYAHEITTMNQAQRSGAYYEVLARRRDNRAFPAELSLAASRSEAQTTFTIIVRDISAQKQAEEDLIASRDRIRTILESITDAFIAFDTSWRFVYANHGAEELLRKSRDELLDQVVWEVFPEAVDSVFYTFYHQAVAEQQSITFETYYEPLSTWFEAHAYPSKEGLSVYFRDISQRKHAEDQLRYQKTLLECQSEAAIDGILVTSADRRWLFFNRRFIEMWNIPDEVITSRSSPQALEAVSTMVVDHESFTETILYLYEHPHETQWDEVALKDGRTFERYSAPVIDEDGTYYGRIWFYRDITERKHLFEQVRIGQERAQTLSRRMVEIQEAERRHIARELHDEIGQALTGLHLSLEMANRVECDKLGTSLKESHALVNELMSRVRELSLNLRPAMLDDLGLLPTLRWFFHRYTTQTGIHVTFKHTDVEQRFAPEIETVVYRLIQEALTNVARYAGVSDVTVRLWSDQEMFGMQVEDQGVGFDAEAALASNASSGLAGMNERVRLLDGYLTIESAPGAGTCIVVELPLR
jgi:PAS domain S-box-containing protein